MSVDLNCKQPLSGDRKRDNISRMDHPSPVPWVTRPPRSAFISARLVILQNISLSFNIPGIVPSFIFQSSVAAGVWMGHKTLLPVCVCGGGRGCVYIFFFAVLFSGALFSFLSEEECTKGKTKGVRRGEDGMRRGMMGIMGIKVM